MKSKRIRAFSLACIVVASIGLWGSSATGGGCPPNKACGVTEDPHPKLCRSSWCGFQDKEGYCVICLPKPTVPEAESG